MYDELAMEREIKDYFGVDADIRKAIAFRMPIGPSSEATLFLNKKSNFIYLSLVTLGSHWVMSKK